MPNKDNHNEDSQYPSIPYMIIKFTEAESRLGGVERGKWGC